MKSLKRNMDIIIILVVGFVLRFTISFTHSYSNDELSAINRLQYDNFSDLIEFGVKTGDMHPAGVQLFMKAWSLLGGTNELFMRFPFVLCGTLSVLIIFLIGNKWVNRSTGLIAAIFLSLLYFPILNSEFARPYSPGLLFCLLSAWFYLKLLFDKKAGYKYAILMGISLAAAMYTHHFAFLFVGWIGFSGLLFIKKTKFKFVLLAAGLAIILYLPHVAITQYQLSVGGLQWLGPPESDWLLHFIFYAFNESWWIIGTIGITLLLSVILNRNPKILKTQVLILSVIWFFGIYIVAHVYSLVSTPVLKYPVMLFAFPFLLIPLSYMLSRFKYQGVLFSVLMIVLATSTTREKDLFGNMHYELFREVAVDITRWNEDYGEENIYTVYNINNPNYMNFYANQWGEQIHFDWDVLEFGDAVKLREDLLDREEDYCIVGYSARLTLPQVFETCKEFYPTIVEYKKYNNAAVFLLSRKQPNGLTQQKATLAYFDENNTKGWILDEKLFSRDTLYDQDSTMKIAKGYLISGENNYGPHYEFLLNKIEDPFSKYIKVSVQAVLSEGAQLTASVNGTRNNQVLEYRGEPFWQGRDLERMIETAGEGYFVFKIPDFLRETDQLKIGVWSRNPDQPVYITRMVIEVYDNIWN
ncbi:MAG: glycosyltransferase family 39 protein [Crocinitomicaceae bacterium]|nr:glycosyltransferase family 39 protein [Crocinitomicaceae bacterium]